MPVLRVHPVDNLLSSYATTISRYMDIRSGTEVRQDYRRAVEGFAALLQGLQPDSWERPALGVWSVRDLAGHASRALLTVESYLDPERRVDDPSIDDAVGYFRATAAALADPAAVAERGRQAGAALGDQPAAAVSSIVERVLMLVDSNEDEALVSTPVGTMTLAGYLPTRSFELVVHSLDLSAATGAATPVQHAEPLAACLHLAAELAIDSGSASDVLLALTGRGPLPAGFSVI